MSLILTFGGIISIFGKTENGEDIDSLFEEIETDDPVGWLRDFVKGKDVELTVDEKESGDLTVFVENGGVTQKFLFTRL